MLCPFLYRPHEEVHDYLLSTVDKPRDSAARNGSSMVSETKLGGESDAVAHLFAHLTASSRLPGVSYVARYEMTLPRRMPVRINRWVIAKTPLGHTQIWCRI